MIKKNDILRTTIITIGSILLSMAITYSLCMIWGENQMIGTNHTVLISFIAPLIITPIVCAIFITLNNRLKVAMQNIRTLQGLLPICASCKKIRDDKGYWKQIESYIQTHSEAEFSHGLCPDCFKVEMGRLGSIDLPSDGNGDLDDISMI